MKKVLFFGIYDPDYSRSRVLMRGFRQNGWEVVECRADPRTNGGFRKYLTLWREGQKARTNHFDLIIVAFPGQTVVWLARFLFGKRIIFDAFLSLYDSNVFDRKVYGAKSIGGLKDYFLDWYSVRLALRTLIDTSEHIKYFSETFHIPQNRFIRVLIGADDMVFSRKDGDEDKDEDKGKKPFVVEFHGTFIPLQGVEYIVEAAHYLNSKNVIFNLCGSGQTFTEVKKSADELKVTNVNFLGKVPFTELPPKIIEADVCIGILGSTEKTKRVIPNKVYECAAMGKAVITADSPAIREVFTNKKDMLFCAVADAKNLAEKIELLMNDRELRATISAGAARTFARVCSPRMIVAQLLSDLHL